MIFELKDKITKLVSSETSAGTPDRLVRKEALSALINLGYKNNIAKDAIDKVVKEAGRKLTLEILLTESLKILSGR